jgi:hypothetical protein
MSTSVFYCRLFGGRDVSVAYDGSSTVTILGQSITISSLSALLQAMWQAAIGGSINGINTNASRGAMGGDDVSQAIGAILDATPSVRTAVAAALATYPAEPGMR